MTKDKKKYFRFESKRKEGIVMSHIRELILQEQSTEDIIFMLNDKFNITACRRTMLDWIKEQRCRVSGIFEERQAYMNKLKKEYQTEKTCLTPEEVQLEEMFLQAKSRGYYY